MRRARGRRPTPVTVEISRGARPRRRGQGRRRRPTSSSSPPATEREEHDGLTLKKGRTNIATKVNAASKLIKHRGDRRVAARDRACATGTLHALARRPQAAETVDAGALRGRRRQARRAWAASPRSTRSRCSCMPDLMTLGRQRRRRPDARPPGQDDRPLRERRRPDGDPRRAARPAAAGRPRVADEHRRLRLEDRGALLPVDRGHGPAHQAADDGAAVGPRGRRLGAHRRHARRAQGAGQRGRPRRERARLPDHRTPSRAASTRSGSTASAPSPAAASASGAPARSRATPSGATSTCAGCSTTSPSRSWRARSGACSSPTTSALWTAAARSSVTNFLTRVWRGGALFGATPAEAFFVKCDAETNPPEVDRGRPGRLRDRHRAGQAGRVRDLPPQPVHRRRRRRSRRVTSLNQRARKGTLNARQNLVHGNYAFTHRRPRGRGASSSSSRVATCRPGRSRSATSSTSATDNGHAGRRSSGGGHQTTWSPIDDEARQGREHGALRLVQEGHREGRDRRRRSRARRSTCYSDEQPSCPRGS